jgi:hypothetical protein
VNYAISIPLPDTSPLSHGSMVPGPICINDHLEEGKTSIPQYSIYPCDSILLMPFRGIIFPLEGFHPDNDEASRAAAGGRRALFEESASHGGGGNGGEAAPTERMVDGVRRVH